MTGTDGTTRTLVGGTTAAARGRWRAGLGVRLRAVRAFSFPLSALPVLVATAAAAPPAQWRWDLLAAAVLGAVLFHAAGNLLNDYFDFRSGVDAKLDGPAGPGRPLLRREMTAGQVLGQAVGCLILAGGLAAYLAWRRGPVMAALALVAAGAAYAYTGPPFRLKYRALGEPLIFAVFGPALMLGAAYAQTGRFEMRVLLLSIPIGLATTAVLVGNNLRDREEDLAAGIRTLARLAGGKVARWLYVLLVSSAALGLAGISLAGIAPITLTASPLLLVLLARPIKQLWRGRPPGDIDAKTAGFQAALLLLAFLALVWNA